MKKSVLGIALATTFAVPTFAENSLNPFEDEKSGFYLGLGLGKAEYKDAHDNNANYWEARGYDASIDDSDTIGKVFTGYRINKYTALELGYYDLGEAAYKDVNVFGDVYKDKSEVTGYGIKAIGFYPINDSFELQASAGIMRWKVAEKTTFSSGQTNKNSEKGSSFTVGLGANYNLTKNIAFGLQWERINNVGKRFNANDQDNINFGKTDIDLYTLSAQYNF